MAHIAARPTRSRSIFAAFRGVAENFLADTRHARAFQQTYTKLSALSDRELADIGVDRSDIVNVAHTAANRS